MLLHTWSKADSEKRQITQENQLFLGFRDLINCHFGEIKTKLMRLSVIKVATREVETREMIIRIQEEKENCFLNRSRDQFIVISEKLIRAQRLECSFYRTELESEAG